MKSFSVISRLLCGAIFFYVYSLYNMELKEYVLNKEDDRFIWELVLNNGIALFDYKMIGCLAMTNTFFDKLLQNTSRDREEYLNKQAYCLHHIQHNKWHLYNAVRGRIAFFPIAHSVRYMWIERQCLDNPMRFNDSIHQDNFYGELPHEPKPFFNNKGEFCFYGYGELESQFDDSSGAVVEYALGAGKKLQIMECVLDIKKENPSYKLRMFLEFPKLLQALLESTCVYETEVVDEQNKKNKIFALEGAIIPKNYKFYKPYFPHIKLYTSFESLPEVVRKNIKILYERQRLRKKVKNVSGCFGT